MKKVGISVETNKMGQEMGTFKSLFCNNSIALSQLRNMGLNLTDKLAPAKQLFMRQAMGLGIDTPFL